MAIVDMFLKLHGIEGESQDAKHRGEIELVSWNWGLQQSSALGGPTGRGSGKALLQDLTFKHRVDKASPKLIAACASGARIQAATLVLRKTGKSAAEFLKIKLTDVFVASVTLDAVATDSTLPQETVTLQYVQIDFEYAPQKADGSLDTPVTASVS
jgi:type VI secretion system secreted protein Hcp